MTHESPIECESSNKFCKCQVASATPTLRHTQEVTTAELCGLMRGRRVALLVKEGGGHRDGATVMG